jgi:hypothetical protein
MQLVAASFDKSTSERAICRMAHELTREHFIRVIKIEIKMQKRKADLHSTDLDSIYFQYSVYPSYLLHSGS